jgi:hypothetical protein
MGIEGALALSVELLDLARALSSFTGEAFPYYFSARHSCSSVRSVSLWASDFRHFYPDAFSGGFTLSFEGFSRKVNHFYLVHLTAAIFDPRSVSTVFCGPPFLHHAIYIISTFSFSPLACNMRRGTHSLTLSFECFDRKLNHFYLVRLGAAIVDPLGFYTVSCGSLSLHHAICIISTFSVSPLACNLIRGTACFTLHFEGLGPHRAGRNLNKFYLVHLAATILDPRSLSTVLCGSPSLHHAIRVISASSLLLLAVDLLRVRLCFTLRIHRLGARRRRRDEADLALA